MICDHLNVDVQTAAFRIDNVDDPDRPFYTACMKVVCSACGVSFRFLGQHADIPEHASIAAKKGIGSWLSPLSDEIGCLIAPMDTGNPLESIAAEGRA